MQERAGSDSRDHPPKRNLLWRSGFATVSTAIAGLLALVPGVLPQDFVWFAIWLALPVVSILGATLMLLSKVTFTPKLDAVWDSARLPEKIAIASMLVLYVGGFIGTVLYFSGVSSDLRSVVESSGQALKTLQVAVANKDDQIAKLEAAQHLAFEDWRLDSGAILFESNPLAFQPYSGSHQVFLICRPGSNETVAVPFNQDPARENSSWFAVTNSVQTIRFEPSETFLRKMAELRGFECTPILAPGDINPDTQFDVLRTQGIMF